MSSKRSVSRGQTFIDRDGAKVWSIAYRGFVARARKEVTPGSSWSGRIELGAGAHISLPAFQRISDLARDAKRIIRIRLSTEAVAA